MVKNIKRKLISEWNKYVRVWRLLRKPTFEEFKTISKVTVIGLLLIGALGFLISVAMTVFSSIGV